MPSTLIAQTIQRLSDINPGSASSLFSESQVVIGFEDLILFTADDGIHGAELWSYDGTGTKLVKDINDGISGSECQNYYLVNGKVIFTANDGINGMELWETDGTTAGTQLLKDIQSGSGSGVWEGGFSAQNSFMLFNDELYFNGRSQSGDYKLWKTDGTSNGTQFVADLGWPDAFLIHQSDLYISSRDGFWQLNGSTGVMTLVKEDDPGAFFGFNPSDLLSMGDYMLMLQEDDLWRSDGTFDGTMKIKDMEFTNVNWTGNKLTRLGDIALFPGDDGVHGDELWRSDGTEAGTQMVIDLEPGADGYAPQNTIVFNQEYFFKGDNGDTGIELFKSDGTEAGTALVKEFDEGFSGGFSLPSYIYTDGGSIFLKAGDGFNEELWISDGTDAGTSVINGNPDFAYNPVKFYRHKDQLFFWASTSATGFEPYVMDVSMLPIDGDGDGYSSSIDCDDDNADINPSQIEIVYDGADNDCDPTTLDDDLDQDGYLLVDDCNDEDADINPGEMETPYDGVDNDCNPMTFDNDIDQDGFPVEEDCDDNNPEVNPGEMEVVYDGLDNDCDPVTLDDDLDQDGFPLAEDCNDEDATINPNAEEIPNNGVDENCDSSDWAVWTTEVVNIAIEIFPNPASENIFIRIEEPFRFGYVLYDSKGQRLLTDKNTTTIDVTDLPTGVYLLEIKDQKTDQRIVEKIVVER